MGGAGIKSRGLDIVVDLAPQHKLSMCMALISSIYEIAGAAGPPVGSLFVDSKLTWRLAFCINLRNKGNFVAPNPLDQSLAYLEPHLFFFASSILLALYTKLQQDKC